MVWDLRGALLKKQEIETARLVDFEFRLRARTMRLLAVALSLDPDSLVSLIVEAEDRAILAGLPKRTGRSPELVGAAYAQAHGEAQRQLIAELGDPSPHRLA
jgi:hypothetical protein